MTLEQREAYADQLLKKLGITDIGQSMEIRCALIFVYFEGRDDGVLAFGEELRKRRAA